MARVSKTDIAKVIDELLNGRLPTIKVAEVVAAYLISERRTKDLDSVMRKVLEQRSDRGLYEADIVSAHELDEKIIKQLEDIVYKNYANAKKIIMHRTQDDSLVGGVFFNTADIQLDTSIHNKLRELPQLINGIA